MISDTLNRYLLGHSRANSPFLSKVEEEVQEKVSEPHMICGPLVGTLLKFLVRLTEAKLVLDVGTFVGFSALSIAEALQEDGRVITCEKSQEHIAMSKKNFQKHPDGHKVILYSGYAMDCIKEVDEPIDLSFLDADKRQSIDYYNLLVEKTRPGGIIVVDDALWKGQITEMSEPKHQIMDELNKFILADSRVENVLIPLRHGINLVYKLKS